MGGDDELIVEARRLTTQLRTAASLLEEFTGRLDRLTAELRWDVEDGEHGGEEPAQ